MPSFLSKVFGRKKEDVEDTPKPLKVHASNPSLLEGKFEAVSPPSPNVTTQDLVSPREGSFALFRTKSRHVGSPLSPDKRVDELPTLSLNLPGQRDDNGSRPLGVVFEGDRDVMLDDSVIGSKRLNPTETVALVRACSQVITERGLETLGIMHPRWHSASPEIQRRLISLFIRSLTAQRSASTPFESELKFTRSPHDVAAVLRWGLRHLQLDGSSFGKDPAEWAWYQTFSAEERAAAYPPKAFSEKLLPLLPEPHLDLLLATLEIESSLAAHAEHNSISGSKLSKFLGLWLLTANRAEVNDDWETFYARWERAGRILEHLFLARIRDESVTHRMPTRLTELVNQYPYRRNSTSNDEDDLLPRPRSSTRPYNALFVRIDTELPISYTEKPKRDRLQLLAQAFKLDSPSEGGALVQAWDNVKKAALDTSEEDDKSASDAPVLNRVFADETIRLLSLIPADSAQTTINLISPSMERPTATRRRSSSLSRVPVFKSINGVASNGGIILQSKAAASPPSPLPAMDWAEFSSAGFGDVSTVGKHLSSTLLDQDIETTKPSAIGQKMSRSKRNRNTSRRSSVDSPNPNTPPPMTNAELLAASKASLVSVIQLDEAFVDFWSDAALDPISSSWPTFVICKLNSIPGVQVAEGKPIRWLVIEQTYSAPPVPRTSSPESAGARASSPTSPRLSLRADISRMNSTLSATRKRFSFFGGSNTATSSRVEKNKRKSSLGSPEIGEMGEILQEGDEKLDSEVDATAAKGVDANELAAVTGSAAVAVVGASGVAVAVGSSNSKKKDNVDATPTKDVDVKNIAARIVESEDQVNTATGDVTDAASPETAEAVDTAAVDVKEFSAPVVSAAVIEENAEERAAPQPNTVKPAVHFDEGILDEQPAVEAHAVEEPAIQGPEHTAEESIAGSTAAEAAPVEPTETLPTASEAIILSGNTPGPRLALGISGPVTTSGTQASLEASPTVIAAEPPIPTEDAPGPQVVMDTKPATTERLKDQEEEEVVEATPIPQAEPAFALAPVPIISAPAEVTVHEASFAPATGLEEVTKEMSEPENAIEADTEPETSAAEPTQEEDMHPVPESVSSAPAEEEAAAPASTEPESAVESEVTHAEPSTEASSHDDTPAPAVE